MQDQQAPRPWPPPDRAQGLLFDGGMVLANFIILTSLNQVPVTNFTDVRTGFLLGLGILTQFVGAYLKKGPLRQRIEAAADQQASYRENVLGCHSFIHFIFFLLAAAMALALVGFVNLDEANSWREFIWLLISFVAATLTSGMVWLAIRNPNNEHSPDIRWRYQELAANVLLWLSASILTRFFSTALLFESEPLTYLGFSLRAFVLIAATSALFMVFYVPSRLLFLAEDYKYPATWLRLWLVAMLPLLSVVLLGRSI